jgi:glycosyltransferase involved in cell wall biosynthesis
MKKLELYTFIYNDQDFLPFFLKYYSFVDRMTFIDSGSTDDTLKILNKFATPSNPVIRITQTGLETWDQDILHEYRNFIWKDTKHDIVMLPDCDEIFYHPELINYLNNRTTDIFEMDGYEMVSNRFPAKGSDILNIKTGVYHHIYNKSTIFNPKIEISFLNAHIRYSPCANIDMGGIKLLHYRNLGIDFMKKRRDREQSRLPKKCNWRQVHSDSEIKQRHSELMEKAIKVI